MTAPDDLLACPETHQPLALAPPAVIDRLNDFVTRGALRDMAGERVREPLDGGWLRQDGERLYPIRGDVADLRIEAGIVLHPADLEDLPE